ncbi:MAG: hypothetical protein WC758_02780 [Candidatus Woesearchaeota archaeon]|jgi:hypothetical protein
MVVKRKVSINRIFTAFIIAILLFGIGITLGIILDNQRVKWSTDQAKTQKLDYESLQWQYLFLSSRENKQDMCVLLQASLEKSVEDLGTSLEKIQEYQQQASINTKDYELIEREYTINNLKYWFLASRTREECGVDNVIILYFFSQTNCPICSNQGVILTHYKNIYQDKLLVFPINVDLENEETNIKLLKNMYDVKYLPSIVVGDTRYEGVVDSDRLGKIICNSFEKESLCRI